MLRPWYRALGNNGAGLTDQVEVCMLLYLLPLAT
jgi:hypothetical protein